MSCGGYLQKSWETQDRVCFSEKISPCFPASLVPTPLRPSRPGSRSSGHLSRACSSSQSGSVHLLPGAALTKPPPPTPSPPGGFTQHKRVLSKFWGRKCKCGALVRLAPCVTALGGVGGAAGKSSWQLDLQLQPLLGLLPRPSSYSDTSTRAGPLLP